MKSIRRYAIQRLNGKVFTYGIFRSVNGGPFKQLLKKDDPSLWQECFDSRAAAETELEIIEQHESVLHCMGFPTYVIHYENSEGVFKFSSAFCFDDYARAETEAREYLLESATVFEERFRIIRFESRNATPRTCSVGERFKNEVHCELNSYGKKVCRKAYAVQCGNAVWFSYGKQIARQFERELKLRNKNCVSSKDFENVPALLEFFSEYSTEPHRMSSEVNEGASVSGMINMFWHPETNLNAKEV